MNNNFKIWICGQIGVNGSEENILQQINNFKYFDGAVYSINYNESLINSKTGELDFFDCDGYKDNAGRIIENFIRKCGLLGEVIYTKWVNLHHISPTIIMQSGHFNEGDWILFIDSPEILKEEFASTLKDRIAEWKANGFTCAGWNRIYLFEWNPNIVFIGSPHQSPANIRQGKYFELCDESKVKYTEEGCHFGDFILNKRKQENSHIIHATKYTFCYNLSNQLTMFYSGQELNEHEFNRQQFIKWFKLETGSENTLENLESYLINTHKNKSYNEYLIKYFDYEFIYKDFFRFKVLKHSLKEILDTRKTWSFSEFAQHNVKI